MQEFKKLFLLLCLFFGSIGSYAQNANWLMGTWHSPAVSTNKTQLIRTIDIDSVSGESFSGVKTSEFKGSGNAKIVTHLSGYISNEQFYIKNGAVLYKKETSSKGWTDCSGCTPENKISIQGDRIILTSTIADCQAECNGTSIYYKALCDFDTITQRYLVKRFGTASLNKDFTPCFKKSPEMIAEEKRKIEDSINNAADLARQRKQQIEDSISNINKIARQKQQQLQDSLENVAKLAKKRQQEIQDSITKADNIAKIRQQQIDDSLKVAASIAKKRQQAIDDSTANAAAIEKKRQEKIDDSLKVVENMARKRQQQIEDSITNANNIARKRQLQQTEDSLKNVAREAKLRQQQIKDSTENAIRLAKKRQQAVDDSLAVAAGIAKKRRKEIDDSTKAATVFAKRRQQQIEDSITNANNIAKQKQQHIDDSLAKTAITKKVTPVLKDTAKTSTTKAFETRDNVLLQTYHIATPDILIELFDNAQIDGDRVSVYHNNELIVSNKALLREPITIKVHADPSNRQHEFTMIAENLGAIAPNTALMRITAGSQVYKLSVKTDLKTNAKIVFYYDGN